MKALPQRNDQFYPTLTAASSGLNGDNPAAIESTLIVIAVHLTREHIHSKSLFARPI